MAERQPRPRPERVHGPRHFFAAAGYSIAGTRRLWRESAFRQEVLGGAIAFALLALAGVGLARIAGFAVLFLMLVACEALNTAVEVLVDQLSPEWSGFARDAKDLASLAVGALLVANGIYLAWAFLA